MKLKGRPANGGRPFLEAVHEKLEWHRLLSRWHVVTRVVDRHKDEYDEVIVDRDTGTIVREVHEPLTSTAATAVPGGSSSPRRWLGRVMPPPVPLGVSMCVASRVCASCT